MKLQRKLDRIILDLEDLIDDAKDIEAERKIEICVRSLKEVNLFDPLI